MGTVEHPPLASVKELCLTLMEPGKTLLDTVRSLLEHTWTPVSPCWTSAREYAVGTQSDSDFCPTLLDLCKNPEHWTPVRTQLDPC